MTGLESISSWLKTTPTGSILSDKGGNEKEGGAVNANSNELIQLQREIKRLQVLWVNGWINGLTDDRWMDR